MIHYHGTPMTPVADMVKAFAARHAMVSFEHPEQMDLAAEICQSVVLDNGAFSAWRQQKTHDFAGYIEWCAKWLPHPAVEWCVIPDKIDGTEEDNDALLTKWPYPKAQSVPVWHMHESLGRLLYLMEWPRIALGSSGDFARVGTAQWWRRMAEAMSVLTDAQGHPLVKLHGLRMLDPGVFSKLPLASADSCNVARNVGFDSKWKGAYVPHSKAMKALIIMERTERHASASRWNSEVIDDYQNMELLG